MKKLILTAATVCAVIGANAATMTWAEQDRIYTPDTEDGGAFSDTKLGNGGMVYLFELSAADYAKLFVSGDYAKSAENVFKQYATVDAKTGAISVDGASQSAKTSVSKFSMDDSRTFYTAGGAGNDAYAAIILTTTGDDGKDYYIANIAKYSFSADADYTNPDMALWQFGDSDGTAIDGWTGVETVPEPFSGSLAVLGMGLLALRRKMKKAKKA